METRIVEIAERIKGLREMMDITPEEMAEAAGVELEEYLKHENGEQDFGFTFLYKCADKLDVDIVELLTGENPRLSFYSIVRKGEGLDIKRRAGFKYEHLNYRFKNKIAETFLVQRQGRGAYLYLFRPGKILQPGGEFIHEIRNRQRGHSGADSEAAL